MTTPFAHRDQPNRGDNSHRARLRLAIRLSLAGWLCATAGASGAFAIDDLDVGRGTLEPTYAPEVDTYSLTLDGTADSLALFPRGIGANNRTFIRPAGAPWREVVTGPSIAGGGLHSLALRADGSVQAWGLNGDGQTDVPTAARSNVIAVAAGSHHSLALRNDGTVVGWGLDDFGQAEPAASVQGQVVAIAAGGRQSLALLADGSLRAWGAGPTPPPMSDFVAIAAGEHHALALNDSGGVIAWGSTAPVPPEASADVVAIAAADNRSLALKRDGSIVIWGWSPTALLTVPAGARNAVAIAATRDYNLVIRADGTLFVWGDGSSELLSPPVITDVAAIAGGRNHALGVRRDGSLVTWGDPGNGLNNPPLPALHALALPVSAAWPVPYGAGSTALRVMPTESAAPVTVPVASLRNRTLGAAVLNNRGTAIVTGNQATTWGTGPTLPAPVPDDLIAISTGSLHTLAINTDGDLVAWGSNAAGQLNAPADATNLIAVSAGPHHSLALRADGRVLAWGNSGIHSPTNISPAARSGVVAIAAGYNFNLALRSDGSVAYWGDPYKPAANLPPEVSADVVAIAVGHAYALALKSDGTPIAWGGSGPIVNGIPANATGLVAIAMGGDHALGLRGDGEVVAWGSNAQGQTDVPVAAQSDVVAIAGGQSTSYALKADGTLVAWGASAGHPTSDVIVPDLATPVVMTPAPPAAIQRVPLATGMDFSVALDTTGTPIVWGYGTQPPAALDGLVAVDAGDHYVLALNEDGVVTGWGSSSPMLAIPSAAAGDVVAIAAGPEHALALKDNGEVVAWGSNYSGALNVPNLNPDSGASYKHVFTAVAAAENVSLGLRSDGRVIAWGSPSHGVTTVPAEAQSGVVAIAAGRHHALALKVDGTVVAWGDNGFGEASGVRHGAPVVAMTAGEDYSAFLRADGTVLIQGDYSAGLDLVELPDNVIAMAGGRNRLTLLTADGSLFTLGDLSTPSFVDVMRPGPPGDELTLATTRAYPDPSLADASFPVGTLSPAFDPATNLYTHTVPADSIGLTLSARAATSGATLQMQLNGAPWQRVVTGPSLTASVFGPEVFGVDTQGRLVVLPDFGVHVPTEAATGLIGVGTTANTILALKNNGSVINWYPGSDTLLQIPVEAQAGITAIATGGDRVLALRDNGSVLAWNPGNTIADFLPEETQDGVVGIAAKNNTYLALRSDGSAFGWGNLPAAPPEAASGVAAITAGDGFALLVTTGGSVVPWGDLPAALIPFPAELDHDVVTVRLGQSHALALKADGTVVGWGELNGSAFTVPATALTDIVTISIGSDVNAVQKTDGSVVAWDGFGTIEQHALNLARPQSAPLPLRAGVNRVSLRVTPEGPALPDAAVATKRERHLLALHGAVVASATNLNTGFLPLPPEAREDVVSVYSGNFGEYALKTDGSLLRLDGGGLPYEVQPSLPGESPVRAPIATVAVGYHHALLLRTDGTLYAWGGNLPENVPTDVVAIAAGEDHALALRRGGTLACWDAAGTLLTAPSHADIVAIAAKGDRNLALRATGEVIAWSVYGDGHDEPEPPTEARSGVVGIAMNKEHRFAIKADGTVVSWGLPFSDAENQTPPTTASSEVLTITTANLHQIALKTDGSLVTWGHSDSGFLLPLNPPSPLLEAPVKEYHFIITRAAPALVLVAGNDTAPEHHLPDLTGLHDFGLRRFGVPVTQGFTLLNAGSADLIVTAAAVDNPAAFALSGLTLPLTLAPGQQTGFNVLFDPESPGSQSSVLTLDTNQPDDAAHRIDLHGESVHLPSEVNAWRLTQFTLAELADPGLETTVWGDQADPDGDGLANLLEYALALPARAGTSAGPVPTLNDTPGGPRLALTFTRLKRAAAAGMNYQVEWSDTLEPGSWSTTGIEETVMSSDAETETIDASVSAAAPRRFLRLRVTRP